jgi:YidC/Oxa1 family membrane protein insertase
MYLPTASNAIENILSPLIWLFKTIMVFFHNHVVASWGLSIIFLTIVVRAVLLPLTLKQYHSMQALQRLQPEIKKLQEKYKGDKQRLNQEMMRFYQENKVNPLASCLPLVAQFPVFISLFYMLRKDLREEICHSAQPCGHAAQFLFIPDLTNKATGAVLITLMLLYAGSQLLSSLLMLSANPDKQQRIMMMVLPLIFVPIMINFPAGVVVYWITTNCWTIVQQQIVRRRLGPMQPAMATATGGGGPARAQDGGAKPVPQTSSGGGGLLARARAAVEGPPQEDRRATKPTVNGRGTTSGPPPRPPRRKKKRSGRRR